MSAPFALLQHTQQRLQLVKQLNATALFLALAVLGWVLSWLILHACALPLWWSLFPLVVSVGFWSLTIWRVGQEQEVDVSSAAHVIDAASQGKARFLTLATAPSTLAADSLQSVVLHQAEQLTASFELEREVPLVLERRVRWFVGAAAASLLLLLFTPFPQSSLLSPFLSKQELSEELKKEELLAQLEETARQLMTPTATAQEQIAGARLQTLAQQLRDPSLSPQEKQQQIEELQKRWNLDIPLPQLLPFDLQLLASNNKDDKGQGNEEKDAQGQQSSSAAGTQQSPEQSQPSSSPSEGINPQQEPQKNREKNNQPKPQPNGGSLALKFPQPQAKGQEQSPQEASGSEQTSAQGQKPDENLPGADPNRPGDNQQAQNQTGNDPNQPGQAGEGQKKPDQEGGVGVGKGESARKLGEQPDSAGSGFLTEDARFVKVRVPLGQEASGGEDGRTEHTGRATPKTPYSNAPLKESAPEQAQTKQPIPLEYRSILAE